MGTVWAPVRRTALSASAIVALATPAVSPAADPGYDCARASGQVEELVCKDDALAALDRKLGEVYGIALENYPRDERSSLQAQQRGWIKGRNDCWKADDVRDCVAREYSRRIVELQITAGQLMAPKAVAFDCPDVDKTPLYAAFYTDADPAAVVLTLGDDQVIAFIARSGSGSRYVTAGVEFWEHHGEATVTWFGVEFTCRLKR